MSPDDEATFAVAFNYYEEIIVVEDQLQASPPAEAVAVGARVADAEAPVTSTEARLCT